MELQSIVERVADIRHAQPTKNVRQRVQEAADELSRAGDMQLRVELCNEALAALTAMLYQADTDQQPANIDPVTWRLLVPAPWGSGGWRRWGLRAWEAETLRGVLRVRSDARKHIALYDYNDETRTWHLAVNNYATLTTAMEYLKAYPVTLAEWRPQATAYRNRMHQAQLRYRERAMTK